MPSFKYLRVIALTLSAAPAFSFQPLKQAPALFRAAQLSKSGIDTLLANKLILRHRSNPQGVRGLASMGFLDAMLGSVKGGAGRDYSDLKAGDFPAETAQYALSNEVKSVSKDGHAIATFGGGCFWGVELLYQRVPGVIGSAVGYTQGEVPHASYEMVCTGMTGHTEVVQLSYDPSKVSMKELTRLLFSKIDPTLKDQVGNDMGSQYRHGVYFHTPEQKAEAAEVFAEIKAKYGSRPIYTELKEAKVFYPAEDYHQQYLAKGPRGRPQSAAKGCNDPIRCYG